jgi:hypothetical protein
MPPATEYQPCRLTDQYKANVCGLFGLKGPNTVTEYQPCRLTDQYKANVCGLFSLKGPNTVAEGLALGYRSQCSLPCRGKTK